MEFWGFVFKYLHRLFFLWFGVVGFGFIYFFFFFLYLVLGVVVWVGVLSGGLIDDCEGMMRAVCVLGRADWGVGG